MDVDWFLLLILLCHTFKSILKWSRDPSLSGKVSHRRLHAVGSPGCLSFGPKRQTAIREICFSCFGWGHVRERIRCYGEEDSHSVARLILFCRFPCCGILSILRGLEEQRERTETTGVFEISIKCLGTSER